MSAQYELTVAVRELHEFRNALAVHKAASEKESRRLESEIKIRQTVLAYSEDGIRADLVEKAKAVIYVMGQYENAGQDRASVISDAIAQLATGNAKSQYSDLRTSFLGTKNYDRWRGQRCDCTYGYGPRHGSIIFSVGLIDDVRKRKPFTLTPDEIEASIYYLKNIERIQRAEKAATEAAA